MTRAGPWLIALVFAGCRMSEIPEKQPRRDVEAQTPSPTPSQKFTEAGTVRARTAASITLERPTGDRIELEVGPQTTVRIDGRAGELAQVSQGAEVRASYVVTGEERVAERLDVVTHGAVQPMN